MIILPGKTYKIQFDINSGGSLTDADAMPTVVLLSSPIELTGWPVTVTKHAYRDGTYYIQFTAPSDLSLYRGQFLQAQIDAVVGTALPGITITLGQFDTILNSDLHDFNPEMENVYLDGIDEIIEEIAANSLDIHVNTPTIVGSFENAALDMILLSAQAGSKLQAMTEEYDENDQTMTRFTSAALVNAPVADVSGITKLLRADKSYSGSQIVLTEEGTDTVLMTKNLKNEAGTAADPKTEFIAEMTQA